MELSELLKMAGNLDDREPLLRAARELGAHKTPEALAVLLYSRFPDVSREAVRSLVRIGSPQVLPRLLDALPDMEKANAAIAKGAPRDEAVRADMHAAIKRISGKPADHWCYLLIGHQDGRMREMALNAMARKLDPDASRDTLLKASAHADPIVRSAAIRALARSADARAAEAVRQCALNDAEPRVREAATVLFTTSPMRGDLPTLLRLVDVSEGSVREDLILAIGKIDTEEARAAFRRFEDEEVAAQLRLCESKDERTRRHAISAVWRHGAEHAATALRLMARETQSGVQWELCEHFGYDLEYLRHSGYWNAVRAELKRIAGVDKSYAQEWAAKMLPLDPWPPDLAMTIAALGSADADARSSAVEWIREHRGRTLAGLAQRLYEAEATRARFADCCGLAAQAEPQRTVALLDALGDADDGMRRIAAWIVWELLDLPGPPDLVPALAHRLPRVRALAASYLGRKREARALPALAALRADADAGIRRHAIRAVARIGAKGAMQDGGPCDVRLAFTAPSDPA